MKKSVSKSGTVASLTARSGPNAFDDSTSHWLTKEVDDRLQQGQSLLVDLATDLPFGSVLRGRVAPPKEPVLRAAEPLAKLMRQFGPHLPELPIDASYIQARHGVIARLEGLEQSCENFIGLVRRARAVMAAQLEKAMRQVYAIALDAAPGVQGLKAALDPLAPVLAPVPAQPKADKKPE